MGFKAEHLGYSVEVFRDLSAYWSLVVFILSHYAS